MSAKPKLSALCKCGHALRHHDKYGCWHHPATEPLCMCSKFTAKKANKRKIKP